MSSNTYTSIEDNELDIDNQEQKDIDQPQDQQDQQDQQQDKMIKSKIYNLSVKDIGDNLSQTVIDMLNEFSLYRNDENKRWTDYVHIITNEDRLIYVGIIFVIISLIVFFIDVSR